MKRIEGDFFHHAPGLGGQGIGLVHRLVILGNNAYDEIFAAFSL